MAKETAAPSSILHPPSSFSASSLSRPVADLEGVGPARAKHLKLLGVHTLGDLLEYFPRTYQLESSEQPISQLTAGEHIQRARGRVVACDYIGARPRARFEATIEGDDGDKLALLWFNAAYLRNAIVPGMLIRVQGKVRMHRNMPQMAHPNYQKIDEETERIDESTFRTIYPATASLPSEAIARIVEQNLDDALPAVEEWFEPSLLKKHVLMGRRDAYRAIHRPVDMREAQRARRRIVFDELMLMQLGLGISKRMRDGQLTAPVLRADKLLDERIAKRFPFEMTNAQKAACYQIIKDVQSGKPMNRLLQGDVGSGKTVVALYAMLLAVANRMQAAILAPTEVLAEQHFLTLSNFLKDSSVSIELLTSRTKKQSRKTLQKHIADGKVHLAVGTQALIQEDVEFANLGLVVVDEQHKLGVRQRATLRSKGSSPHYLVMTATPIPRTLALSYFADFDVTIIDELPPGRQPIETKWLRASQAATAYEFIRSQIDKGRQAYIVLPQIDDTGSEDTKSVLKEFDRLSKGPLHGVRLGVLHGQMETDEKHNIMTRFRDGQLDVLIATTVIEVGIDVPNATVIVIDNADRFGLSQLHQLRGRVGRGGERSYCLLISDAPTENAEARLQAMTRTNDGFEIAEMDLSLRGPGHFFGTRQHGLPEFKMADITSEIELLKVTKADAIELLARDPKLSSPRNRNLNAAVEKQFGERLKLAQVG
ncbi:MAG: ATP-dependent helicase RecG [Phycisphaerales bacterium]|jgi:ATP-dependent DNA helicase RecG|nr:ATP-dependent helicase RecG [Phycisphaerales bacterium]